MAKSNTILVDKLYSSVEKSLASKDNLSEYHSNIDKHLAKNSERFFTTSPNERPLFSTEDSNKFIALTGLSADGIKQVLKDSKVIKSNWYIMNDPFNIANSLATRYFAIKKNKDYIDYTIWYLIVSMYPSIHFKYFKHGINAACMDYTINNLSDKFNIKKNKNLWVTFVNMFKTAYEHHEKKIISGEDENFVYYVQDCHTRMNSFIKNIAVPYYENYNNQKFLEKEYESFEEDNYHEAESSSYDIENITNSVITHLVIHGPDMKLVEVASKTNQVSVNQMRNFISSLIDNKHRDDIRAITEAILFMYLFNDDGEVHSPSQIGTNDFLLYCLKIYKRANTVDKNVIKIKGILDRWLVELGVSNRSGNKGTLQAYRRAFFTFFVLTIQKYGRS